MHPLRPLHPRGDRHRPSCSWWPGAATARKRSTSSLASPLANELSSNVIDLCPLSARCSTRTSFAQRVWFLKSTPSIDGITASGDNINIEHNEGRGLPHQAPPTWANKWWITDEVRYGWKFIHSDERLRSPMRRQFGTLINSDYERGVMKMRSRGSGVRRVTGRSSLCS